MKKIFTLLFVALMAVAAQAQNYQVVLIHADGSEEPVDLVIGNNGDYVTTVDITYNYENPGLGFIDVGHFYFLIDGVRYGANPEKDEPILVEEEWLGHSDETPLYEGSENTYYVGNGYSYNLGIHIIVDDNTYEIAGYTAYVAKGGPVSVDELAAKTVANVRYYNMAGQEMQEANGMTIQVTTYTDGTTSAAKVVK